MAYRAHSRHHVWSRHCVFVSLVLACTCFMLIRIFLTSTDSTGNGDPWGFPKLKSKKTLPIVSGSISNGNSAEFHQKKTLPISTERVSNGDSVGIHMLNPKKTLPISVERISDGDFVRIHKFNPQKAVPISTESRSNGDSVGMNRSDGDFLKIDKLNLKKTLPSPNSIKNRSNGDSLEIDKLNPKETLPSPISTESRSNGESLEIDKLNPKKTLPSPISTESKSNGDSSQINKLNPKKNLPPSCKETKAKAETHLNFGKKIEQDNEDVFHNQKIFLQDYMEMKKKFKIYAYPHKKGDGFPNIFRPVDYEPSGNYASESYFKKVLMKSHFMTNDPTEADLFYLPFSIASIRHDSRVNVGGIKDFIKEYIDKISGEYPYWNRTNGADHFYVACHSVGRTAMEKAEQVKLNAIQVVCSSSYFVPGYIPHKDVSLPQIWPRKGNSVGPASMERGTLAFYAGKLNSPVRAKLVDVWKNDSEISVHLKRLTTPYSEALLKSKFCLHVKGFEVNTARIGDALYYGCVPIIIADHYELPFNDVLNWKSFSLVVETIDIPLLKDVIHSRGLKQYNNLSKNALKVRKHFQWHMPPLDYDAFYMTMYELWLRRHVLRIPI